MGHRLKSENSSGWNPFFAAQDRPEVRKDSGTSPAPGSRSASGKPPQWGWGPQGELCPPGGAGGRRRSSAHLAGQKGSGCFLLGMDEEVERRRHQEGPCQAQASRDTRAAPSRADGSSRKRSLGGTGSQAWTSIGQAAQHLCPAQLRLAADPRPIPSPP